MSIGRLAMDAKPSETCRVVRHPNPRRHPYMNGPERGMTSQYLAAYYQAISPGESK